MDKVDRETLQIIQEELQIAAFEIKSDLGIRTNIPQRAIESAYNRIVHKICIRNPSDEGLSDHAC